MWFALAPESGMPYHARMSNDQTVTLFRQSAHVRAAGGTTVHVLDRRRGFMLVPPSPCQAALDEILAEKVTIAREAIARRDRAELANRGYCRDCLGTLEA